MPIFDRRSFLRLGTAGLGAALLTNGAAARAPFLGTQVPAFHRFMIGSTEATVVSDGPLPLGKPAASFNGFAAGEITQLLQGNFLPTDDIVLEQNILVLNTGDKLIVFDTGVGTSTMFGPSPGKLPTTLVKAGIQPRDVDAIVLSHAHPDHCGGLVDADGRAVFPNAQVYISSADFNFWTDEAKLGSQLKPFIQIARRNLLPLRDRVVFYADGQEFLPGVQALAAPGHTVGHTMFMITSGSETFCYAADLAHHYVLLLENPRGEFVYDTDAKQAASTRARLLDMLAYDRIRLMGYHFPWPGVGHVVRHGEGFHYIAQPVKTVL
ncbi:MAG: MBL fold metallo-hydrolase [Mesorhizobium sp.]|nr:MAG: MBL fold metallo-hydrolase [Mesorhizobium sp.]